MDWLIKCTDKSCGQQTWAANVVDLIANHRGTEGWLLCRCGKHGYIEKSFELQEPGKAWDPLLRGVIPLGNSGEIYQPFVFLVSYEPDGEVIDIWFSYYKDMRKSGGRLKLGYGPGGPPVLGKQDVLQLLRQLVAIGCLKRTEVTDAIS